MKFPFSKLAITSIIILCSLTLQSQVSVYTGTIGGTYFEMANDIKKIYTGELKVINSAGSILNLKKLQGGTVAFMQYDVLQNAYLSDLKDNTNFTDSIRLLLPLATEEIHLLARTDGKIASFADLNNKDIKVAVGSENEGTSYTAKEIKKLTGFLWTDSPIGFKSGMQALLKGEVDAVLFVGSAPISSLQDFIKLPPQERKLFKIVPIVDDRLAENYQKTIIKANTYEWAIYDVATYAVRTVLVTSIAHETEQHQKDIEKLLSDVKLNLPKLQKDGHRKWKEVNFDFKPFKWDIYKGTKKVFGM